MNTYQERLNKIVALYEHAIVLALEEGERNAYEKCEVEMSNEICPYCKAEKKYKSPVRVEFKCGAAYFCDGLFVRHYACYESQIAAQAAKIERLFTDPENQPTQYGTVTLEYMEKEIAKEIAKEREVCIKILELLLGDSAVEGCDEYRKAKAYAAISKAKGKMK
jgi:hypothetical protein